MPNIADYHAYVAKHDRDARHVHEQRTQIMPAVLTVTQKAQTVVDHPGWQFFLDKIAERVKAVEAMRATKLHQMIFGTAMGHDLELCKVELNAMDAEIRALKYAADLVPQVIQVGQEIAGAHSQVAAGRADT